ncbi:MAG: hypothetical protein IJ224_00475 [Lachnospiraceae bacterium]|nr:hypothetical protein [Lachnospiraceae bacterium]
MDIKKKYKNARAIIVLTATLIAMLLNIKYERDIIDSLIILIIVLIVFYAIASIAIKLIDKIRLMEPKTNVDSDKIPKSNNNNYNNKIEETEEAK